MNRLLKLLGHRCACPHEKSPNVAPPVTVVEYPPDLAAWAATRELEEYTSDPYFRYLLGTIERGVMTLDRAAEHYYASPSARVRAPSLDHVKEAMIRAKYQTDSEKFAARMAAND